MNSRAKRILAWMVALLIPAFAIVAYSFRWGAAVAMLVSVVATAVVVGVALTVGQPRDGES